MKQQFSSKTLIALLCGAAATFNAAAQDSQSTVIVSGSRFEENLNEVPANVQVITREEIAESTSTNIPDILSQIGGLNIRSTAGGQLNLGATVDMGGYGPTAKDTTLILVDGQRINPIDSSGISWESIPLDSINRIEILRGGASVQYGNGALGGVINIITNGGSKTLNQASTSYGSFNTLVSNAIFRNTIDQTTVQLSANTSNTNGWRQNSAANAYSFDGKVTQSLGGKDNVYADLFYSYSNQQMPGGTLGQVGQGNPQLAKFNNIGSGTTVDNSGIRMGLAKALSDTFNLEVDSFYSAKTTFFTQPYYSTTASGVGAFPTISPSFTKYEGWQANFSPRIKGDFGKFGTSIVGYEFNKASQSSAASYSSIMNQAAQAQGAVINPISSSANASLYNQSVYLIQRNPLTRVIDFAGGYRYQTQSASANGLSIWSGSANPNPNQTYSANAGDIAFNFKYLEGQRIYIKWNQSYRFPNVDEFWTWSSAGGSPSFGGILKPQTAQTYELGGNWQLLKTNLTAAVFSSVSQNEILYNPATYNNSNSPYNINRTGANLNFLSPVTSQLSIGGGGTVQNAFYANGPYQNQAIAQVPNLLLNARAIYVLNNNWSLGGVVNYVSNQRYDAAPSYYSSLNVMPSYAVGDIYANYRMGNWETRLTVKNVGNAQYSTYGGYGYVQFPNNSSGNSYYYYANDPRSIYLSAKYNF
ncbi:TonB-dependent receptor [Polynucleobacter sp. AP-Jannik-300A-C4]|uniref:TonB-dependent receptor n=1 Tax=Polynucleobacter sp. AP-Jannik-300A-C4 TaxID=2576928 RepID=UPI001BFCF88D|nr:TonB-dependent receptor [Polynucleobacter sp. AP-Jannik-300A-C4]QWE23162.1 TonB-dependent receptor [Polynucleobacter sp. AP-Jannik-300A-C4]